MQNFCTDFFRRCFERLQYFQVSSGIRSVSETTETEREGIRYAAFRTKGGVGFVSI